MARSALTSGEDEPVIKRVEEDECIAEKILDKPMVDAKLVENLNCDKLLPKFEAELARSEVHGLLESNNKIQEPSSSPSTSSSKTSNTNASATSTTVSIVDLLNFLTLEKKENARLEEQLAVRQKYLQDHKVELERLNKSNAEPQAALAVVGGGEAPRENCIFRMGRGGLKRKSKPNGKGSN